MHEYSIATSLHRMVEEHARAQRATRVVRVHVKVGVQAGVEVDLLRTAWEAVRRDSVCADAELAIDAPPTRWVCGLCGEPVPADGPLRCAECDVPARLATGGELVLERIELEVADDASAPPA